MELFDILQVGSYGAAFGAGAVLLGKVFDLLIEWIKQRGNVGVSAIQERKANIELAASLVRTLNGYQETVEKVQKSFDKTADRLDALTKLVAETNPALYAEYKTEIIAAVSAVPERVQELLPPHFDALKEVIELSLDQLSKQLIARLDRHDENTKVAKEAIKNEADAAMRRITTEIDRLATLVAALENRLPEQNDGGSDNQKSEEKQTTAP